MKRAARKGLQIVVVGGSQGAIEALLQVLPELPPRLPAAFFVVIHIAAEGRSYLPEILARSANFRVVHPADGDLIHAGCIYVAPPNFHMTLEDGAIHVRRGPRENRHRPAIDPLFRTAARSFGPAVVAVLLSGNLDDGSAGLFAVRARGGLAVVQQPDTAQAPEMPQNALDYAGADFVLPVGEIAPKLIQLIQSQGSDMKSSKRKVSSRRGSRAALSRGGNDPEVRSNEGVAYPGEGYGKPSVFACPECHGVLWEVKQGKLKRYRCRVGHSFTEASLDGELDQASERALWAAMRALEEKAAMARRMLNAMQGHRAYAQRLRDQIEAYTANAKIIREMIFSAREAA